MKEEIEVYTEDGTPTGVAKPREEIHSQGIWHKVIHTWIVSKPSGNLLIQRRCPTKESHPDKWDVSSAGHISFGQQSKEAAVRELEEELGLTVPEERFELLFTTTIQAVLKNGAYVDNEHTDVYLIEYKDGELSTKDLTLQESEVSDAQFVHYSIVEKAYREHDERFVCYNKKEQYFELFALLRERCPDTSNTKHVAPDFLN